MTTFLVVLLIGVAVWYWMTHRTPKERPEPVPTARPASAASSDAQKAILAELDYAKARWEERERTKAAGEPCEPKWWWDPPTERQLARLKNDLFSRGMSMTFDPCTKGSVSDVIGVFEDPDPIDTEVMKFFKVPTKNVGQTRARYEAARLLANPENKARWDSRPPDAEQKEFFEFFRIEIPEGATADAVWKLRSEEEGRLREANDPRLNEWGALESIVNDIADPEFREDYEIKKPSKAALRKALQELRAEGHTYEQIASDMELLTDKLPHRAATGL